jgi:hypothetical protein
MIAKYWKEQRKARRRFNICLLRAFGVETWNALNCKSKAPLFGIQPNEEKSPSRASPYRTKKQSMDSWQALRCAILDAEATQELTSKTVVGGLRLEVIFPLAGCIDIIWRLLMNVCR